MSSNRLVAVVVAVLALLTGSPAAAKGKSPEQPCEEGKVKIHGACVPACATTGRFGDPNACECPPGYMKVLFGSGAGECKVASCGDQGADPKRCGCPAATVKKVSHGKASCVEAHAARKSR